MNLPHVGATGVHSIATDDGAFRRQPEERVVHRVALQGAETGAPGFGRTLYAAANVAP